VANENERIRGELTDRTKELIEVYRTGSSEKLGADFSQLILQQINDRQKFLVEENSRLDRDYQRFKSEADRSSRELKDSKAKENEAAGKARQLELNQKQLDNEVKNLKEKLFDSQLRSNELESEKKKIENDLQRALSQVSQLNRDKDALTKNYESLKQRFEREAPQQDYTDYPSPPERTRNPLEETRQQSADDTHKKLAKIQKDHEAVVKERNKLKEQLEQEESGNQ
jgi:chromosome segregation ATPase